MLACISEEAYGEREQKEQEEFERLVGPLSNLHKLQQGQDMNKDQAHDCNEQEQEKGHGIEDEKEKEDADSGEDEDEDEDGDDNEDKSEDEDGSEDEEDNEDDGSEDQDQEHIQQHEQATKQGIELKLSLEIEKEQEQKEKRERKNKQELKAKLKYIKKQKQELIKEELQDEDYTNFVQADSASSAKNKIPDLFSEKDRLNFLANDSDPNEYYVEDVAWRYHNPPLPGTLDDEKNEVKGTVAICDLKPLPPAPPLPVFPRTKFCKWTFDERSRVLHANFCRRDEEVVCDPEDIKFLLRMYERDDSTLR